jgi:hypothetical protein
MFNWNGKYDHLKTDTVKKTDKKPINISFKTILIYEILTCNIIQFDYFFPNKEITLIVLYSLFGSHGNAQHRMRTNPK